MKGRLRGKLFSHRKLPAHANRKPAEIKGNAHNVIVVKSHNDIFTEAIFILRDDYYSSSRESSAQLLNEARKAAGSYVTGGRTELYKKCLVYIPAALMAVETLLVFIYIV